MPSSAFQYRPLYDVVFPGKSSVPICPCGVQKSLLKEVEGKDRSQQTKDNPPEYVL